MDEDDEIKLMVLSYYIIYTLNNGYINNIIKIISNVLTNFIFNNIL